MRCQILEQRREGKIVKLRASLYNHWIIPSFVSCCRLLSEPLLDFFNAEDPSLNNSGDESFSSTRERSVSEPNVFRSRISSRNVPLVSLCLANAFIFCILCLALNMFLKVWKWKKFCCFECIKRNVKTYALTSAPMCYKIIVYLPYWGECL